MAPDVGSHGLEAGTTTTTAAAGLEGAGLGTSRDGLQSALESGCGPNAR